VALVGVGRRQGKLGLSWPDLRMHRVTDDLSVAAGYRHQPKCDL
jgi:hypothetical protein